MTSQYLLLITFLPSLAKLVVVDLVKPSTLVQADEKKDERGLFSMTLASFWTSSAVFSRGKYLSLFETEGFLKVNKISKDFLLSSNTPQNQRIFLHISALASKSGQIKNKCTFLN